MPIEYDENGLVTQTFPEIISEREDALRPTFGSDLDLTGDTVIGNVQTSDADREFDIQELINFVVSQMSIAGSSGIFLDWNAQFKNQIRLKPLKTIITRTINGTNGTTISSGDLTITNQNNGYDFVLSSDVAIGATGKAQAQFESLGFENIETNTSDAFSIATPLSGVTSISYETGDGVIQEGRPSETDEVFKERVVNSDLAGSTGLSESIADKIALLDGVTNVSFIENNSSTDYTYEVYTNGTGTITTAVNSFSVTGSGTTFLTELDANYQLSYTDDATDDKTLVVNTIGSATALVPKNKTTSVATGVSFQYAPPVLPPNSFEIIVLGGDDDEIGQTILDNMVPTTQTIGDTTTFPMDSQGQAVEIKFTRPDEIAVEIELDVYYTTTLSVDEQNELKQELVSFWTNLKNTNSNKGVGLDMDADDFAVVSNTNTSIRKLRNILINRPSEAQTDYIELGKREIAILDASNITLNLVAV